MSFISELGLSALGEVLLYYVLCPFLIFSIIVCVHEYGHYIVAKIFKVKIEVFSIGFGKELFGINDKSGTRWKFSLIPFGGYVKMFGDANIASTHSKKVVNDQVTEEEKRGSFHEKALYQKFLIILAGPMFNFIFAILLLAFLFSIYGSYRTSPTIGLVLKDSAAERSGLRGNDVIVSINGHSINYFEDIIYYLSSNPKNLKIKYLRDQESKVVVVKPDIESKVDIFGNKIEVVFLGITPAGIVSYKKIGLIQALIQSLNETVKIINTTLASFWQIITGSRSMEELGGPIRIAKYSAESAKKGMMLWFMALISINLGVVNLFPIPLVDGGHLFNYIIQALFRKKQLNEKYLQYTSMVGLILLLLLALFSTINDIKYISR